MRAILLLIVIGALLPLMACASASAKAPPDRPTLEVPAPPTKVVDPSPRPEAPIDPVPEVPTAAPANSRPSRPASREPARTDPKPDTTTEASPAPVAPVTPPPQLKQLGTPDPSEAARQVQVVIDRAGKALEALNGRRFTGSKKGVYDNARGLLTQAEEALKKSDFENARKLAEKVEMTAKELQGR